MGLAGWQSIVYHLHALLWVQCVGAGGFTIIPKGSHYLEKSPRSGGFKAESPRAGGHSGDSIVSSPRNRGGGDVIDFNSLPTMVQSHSLTNLPILVLSTVYLSLHTHTRTLTHTPYHLYLLVVMMKANGLKTKISHTHFLILSYQSCLL